MNGDEPKIIAAIEERSDQLVSLACDLIGFDTTTRGEPGEPARAEEPLQVHLADLLSGAGAEVELWEPPVGQLDRWRRQVPEGLGFEGRPQLVARFPGHSSGPSLLFNGHIDVVSAEPRERWTRDPFRPEVCNGLLFGRGACDMKGGVAAMVLAAIVLADEGVGLSGDLIINTVTDEEWNGAGSLATVAKGVSADAGLIPEATDFDPWIACRGVLNPTITIRGRPGHSEIPQPDWREGGAVNAIEKAMPVLEAVRSLREHWQDRSTTHPWLQPGELIPTMIKGGEWWVSYPASCAIVVDVTYLPEQSDADGGWGTGVEREIEDWICERARRDPWLDEHPPSFEWGANLAPAEVPVDHPIVTAALDAGASVGRPGKISAEQGWHDASTFTRFGTPTISYGPSGLSKEGEMVAHAIDEHVPVDELVATAKAMAIAAIRWQDVSSR